MHQYTAAEALMLSEALRGAAASAQAAMLEAQSCQDPQLRQFLQSEAQRHRQSVQKIQQMLGAQPH
ncbi:hypothetical protein [Caldinitratiruptor microaerophilus]|uniref:Uncharacterized protein n=1 Tax=Caldinitratiruptor microaerophilus TaxID=671077 RepID=A0AA35CPK2_9FIRM|nr:hypothetical protein [Caldinitratiruptor microaerophilus]BDG61481.1 hypothetical protein caldi_25710 [Caldinitratiruptor microaerophilus]